MHHRVDYRVENFLPYLKETAMEPETCAQQLASIKEWFDRSTRVLTEDDSTFAPTGEAFTTAQQVAHVAQTVDWFVEGAFRPEGFDMNFDALAGEIMATDSLTKAREWLDRSFAAAIDDISSRSAKELTESLPEGPVMGGAPRFAIISGIQDHTAHHRGALTVYARMQGHTPTMPYMEM